LKILLPIGLSFHTFQAMSYTIEVYRGNQAAEKHFGIYALYVMFYPQLVAGPIERPQNVLHQFHEKHTFDYTRMCDGLKRMLWGFFKKVVIADRLSIMVNEVYNHVTYYEGLALILATVLFGFQIYCDFSGYSDIALGSAQVMGFRLMENFRMPYFSTSIKEFWSRWHISLSTWFRDYLYIPLGGNRVARWRRYLNLFIVFLVSGLWHGANWTYVIWGALHGGYQVIALLFTRQFEKLYTVLRGSLLASFVYGSITFLLVCFAWIFFRASSLSDAWYVVSNLLPHELKLAHVVRGQSFYLGLPLWRFAASVFGVIALLFVEWRYRTSAQPPLFYSPNRILRWTSIYGVIFAILIFGYFETNEFIYFQF
jgi:D-alanyl-lipoteichoic acid acyltransferase DltB (MBOAT superfamily)